MCPHSRSPPLTNHPDRLRCQLKVSRQAKAVPAVPLKEMLHLPSQPTSQPVSLPAPHPHHRAPKAMMKALSLLLASKCWGVCILPPSTLTMRTTHWHCHCRNQPLRVQASCSRNRLQKREASLPLLPAPHLTRLLNCRGYRWHRWLRCLRSMLHDKATSLSMLAQP